MMLSMLSSLEEMERLSKSLIAYMSWLCSLIVSLILSLTNVFRSLTSLPVRPPFFGMPFVALRKPDLPEPLLLRNT
eukprot:79284-Ditylum_brightwellii.AAC.1